MVKFRNAIDDLNAISQAATEEVSLLETELSLAKSEHSRARKISDNLSKLLGE